MHVQRVQPARVSKQHIQCPWGKADAERSSWRPLLLPEPGRGRTELLSFPGSGNSWVRHLIETLTGYRTNSIYHCNKEYFLPEVAADCDKWNVSIVTKSHNFSCAADWERAILLMRHPLRAIRAEYQRDKTWNHTAVIDAQQWNWDDWYKRLESDCRSWIRDYEAVLGKPASLSSSSSSGCAALFNRTTHVFFYEDLTGPAGQLNTHFLDALLQLLGVAKEDAYYACAAALSEGSFKRVYPQDFSHPAVQALMDPRSQRIIASAGCVDAYDAYRAAYPGLPPMGN